MLCRRAADLEHEVVAADDQATISHISPPLPPGEGWGEGRYAPRSWPTALTLTLSRRERGQRRRADPDTQVHGEGGILGQVAPPLWLEPGRRAERRIQGEGAIDAGLGRSGADTRSPGALLGPCLPGARRARLRTGLQRQLRQPPIATRREEPLGAVALRLTPTPSLPRQGGGGNRGLVLPLRGGGSRGWRMDRGRHAGLAW